MRYTIILLAPFLVLLAACGEAGEAPSTPTPAPTRTEATATAPPASEVDVRGLLLRRQDVTTRIIPSDRQSVLSQAQVFTPEEFFGDHVGSGEITPESLAGWRLVAAATQAYSAPFGVSQPGVEFLMVTALLHQDATGTRALLTFPGTIPDRGAIEQIEASPGRVVLSYEELARPAAGDESGLIHFVSEDPDNGAQFDSFWLFFARERVVVMLQIRDEQGALTTDDIESLAGMLDNRVREGLRQPADAIVGDTR